MKNRIRISTAILAGLMTFLIILILSAILFIRFQAETPRTQGRPGGTALEETSADSVRIELDNSVNAITLSGIWECEVEASDSAELSIIIPDSANPGDISWDVKNRRLILENHGEHRDKDEHIKALLRLPYLESISSSTVTSLNFTGFSGEELEIIGSGIADISGKDSRYENILITLSGAGSVDLSGTESRNARVILSGAGSVELNMTGGTLEGELSGLGSIEYRGQVSRNTLKTTGLGRVSPKE